MKHASCSIIACAYRTELVSGTDRLHGLRRWNEYLEARIKPWGIVRESDRDPETDDAVWRVGFLDDTRARIRMTESALVLGEAEFEDLVGRLERADHLRRLQTVSPGGIRIHADGHVEEVDAEGIERQIAPEMGEEPLAEPVLYEDRSRRRMILAATISDLLGAGVTYVLVTTLWGSCGLSRRLDLPLTSSWSCFSGKGGTGA